MKLIIDLKNGLIYNISGLINFILFVKQLFLGTKNHFWPLFKGVLVQKKAMKKQQNSKKMKLIIDLKNGLIYNISSFNRNQITIYLV
jgi:hypothetical protein